LADISGLGNLQESEPLDFDTYKDVGEGRAFPKRGKYTLLAPEGFTSESFTESRAGALLAQIDPTIVGPTNEGYQLRYKRISAKTFNRGGTPASQIGDYLRACGRRGQLSADPQEVADAVEGTAGQVYEALCDWNLYAKGQNEDGTDFVIKGMENFPSDGNGGHVPYVDSPTVVDPETGSPKRLWANLDIVRFLPATD
jgi:hypothetical protein